MKRKDNDIAHFARLALIWREPETAPEAIPEAIPFARLADAPVAAPIVNRLESELAIANAALARAIEERDEARVEAMGAGRELMDSAAALNLARQRAEDAESDLKEAQVELAAESDRADTAEADAAALSARIVELEDELQRTAIAAKLVGRLAAHDAPPVPPVNGYRLPAPPQVKRRRKPRAVKPTAPREPVPSYAFHV